MSHPLYRRELIQGGVLSLLGMGMASSRSWASKRAVPTGSAKSAILLLLVGGPSQVDTWDPKPDAPAEVRGPFRPISTNVGGIQICDIFPRMACHADKYVLIRSCFHVAAPVHDLGHQLLQTGRLSSKFSEHPHIGCVLEKLEGARNDLPGHVLLPGPLGATGGNLSHGQTAGFLTPERGWVDERKMREASDLNRESERMRERYGDTPFGRDCLRARRLVEAGVRFVTVNMYPTVFGMTTWDTHGWEPFTDMRGLRDEVAPAYDRAYSALLEDLSARGLLAETLVVATGEFGRTPKLNPAGGRDHWPQCWTMMMAGGGVRGGQVIGSSDAWGAEPRERPVSAPEVVASMYRALGLPLDLELPDAQGRAIRLLEPGTRPVDELFA